MANIQKTQEHKARLTIDISPELHRLIKTRASLSGVSMKDFTIDALTEHLHENKCEFGFKHEYSEKFAKELEESRKEDGKRKKYISVEDLMKDLNSGI